MLFDTHAHMDADRFDQDRHSILENLAQAGVGLVMNPGCNLASSRQAVELANTYPFVYAAVGSHPDSADEVNQQVLDAYRKLCAENPKVKAIGEIGLDYHYEDIPRQLQKKAFYAQMELAAERNLPVIVHQRDAHEDGLAAVKAFPQVTGVFHCFSGSLELARQLVDLGWYIGFTGVLTFKNARKALEVASAIPKDRIVLETDCPYMTPEPYRGRRNDPSYLPYTALKLAQLWNMDIQQVHTITWENGKRLYRL